MEHHILKQLRGEQRSLAYDVVLAYCRGAMHQGSAVRLLEMLGLRTAAAVDLTDQEYARTHRERASFSDVEVEIRAP